MSCLRCGGSKLTTVEVAAPDEYYTHNVDTGEDFSDETYPNPRLGKIQVGDFLNFTFCIDCGTIQELYSSTWRGSEKQDGRSPVGFETSGDA
jgi:hypothetical protein